MWDALAIVRAIKEKFDNLQELCIDKLSEQIEDLAVGKDAAEIRLADCISKLVTSQVALAQLQSKGSS